MTRRALMYLTGLVLLLAACSQQTPAPPAPLPTEFPNEDGALISPEGQRIIDAVLEGRITAPELITEPLELDDGLGTQGTVPSAVRHPYWSSMGHFWWHRANRSPWYANWSTDYCSNAPDTGLAFNFKKPCARHDYGYRNWKKYSAFTSSAKKSIDSRFLSDMKAHCSTRSIFLKPDCYRTAYIYYAAVRAFG